MYKFNFVFIVCVTLLISCGGEKTNNVNSVESKSEEHEATNSVDEKNLVKEDSSPLGLQLIKSKGCVVCHQTEEKLIGPSYKSVANKYDNTSENSSLLANSIIKGGSGNWGDVIMPGNPNIKEEDAKAIVDYIFSLKD